jgi:GH18 family chitinase
MRIIKKWRGLLIALSFLNLTSAFAQFKMVGYMPSWTGSVNEIQYTKLTHIIYLNTIPSLFNEPLIVPNEQKLKDIVTQGHNNGVKILIGIGTYTNDNSEFSQIASSQTSRRTFVSKVISLVNKYSLDGVDIGWTYPFGETESNNFALLMSELSTALHAENKILSAIVDAKGPSTIKDEIMSAVDFLNINAFDGANQDHASYHYAITAVAYWITTRKLPPAKAVLGIPFYSRPTWKHFSTLLTEGANPEADKFNGEHYNGITTVKVKTDFARRKNLGGMMFHMLPQDGQGTNSLLSAVNEVLGNPISPLPLTPRLTGTGSSTMVSLTWTDNAINEQYYKIERSLNGSSNWSLVTTLMANSTSFSRSIIAGSAPYYYRVKAENPFGVSLSNVVGPLPFATTLPAAPSNLLAMAASTSQINISWIDNSNNENRFRIERSFTGTGAWSLVANVDPGIKTFSNRALFSATRYYYRVRSENNVGNSSYSIVASAITQGTVPNGRNIPADESSEENLIIKNSGKDHVLTLPLNSNFQKAHILLHSVEGEQVLNSKSEIQDNTIEFQLPEVPEGLYILRIKTESKTWVKKYWIKK